MLLWFRRFLACTFRTRRGVYYVNGPDVLPAPLSPEEEAQALSRLPDDETARGLLIEHNLRLVVYIARRFENTGTGLEDLVSIGTVGLIKAINTFCADKNIKLATYASRCIENEILMYMRKRNARRGEISIDEPLNIDRMYWAARRTAFPLSWKSARSAAWSTKRWQRCRLVSV